MESKPPSGWIGGLETVKQRPDLHKIDVPATVVNGTEGQLVSPDVAEAVVSGFPMWPARQV